MALHRVAPLAAALTLFACSEAALETALDRDTGSLGYEGDFALDTVQGECVEGSPDTWQFAVRTEGWADGVTLSIAASDSPSTDGDRPQREDHPMQNVDYDASGAWDTWELTLLHVPAGAEPEAGATTAFSCHDTDRAAFLVVMEPVSGDDVADCAWWGSAPATVYQSPPGVTCTCLNPDGVCS